MLSAPAQPAFGTPITRTSLRRGLVCALIFHGGGTHHDYSGVAGDFFHVPALTSLSFGANKFGKYTELDTSGTNEAIISGITGNGLTSWVPASNLSVSVCFEKSDSTNRACQLCGVDVGLSGTAYYLNMHVPYSDGVVYFDVGGTGAGNRCSVGGLTFGADHFIFTAGPRGQEIWQNGILRASNGNNPTRSVDTTHAYKFGGVNFQVSDIVKLNMHCMWNRQLDLSEIEALSANPYAPWDTPTMYADLGRLSLVAVAEELTGFGASRPIYRVHQERWG